MSLTILIPTYKRLKKFETLLKYYNKNNFKGQILIGEGSTKVIFLKKKNIVEKFNNLDISFFYAPGRVFETLSLIKKFIKYNYVVLTGDDDYLYVNNLNKLINFLKKKRSYTGVYGTTSSIEVYKKNVVGIGDYKNFSNTGKTAIKRLENHLNNHVVTLFAVQRKKFFFKMLECCPIKKDRNKCPSRSISEEFLPCILLATLGKFGIINCFYLYRVTGHKRLKVTRNYKTRKFIKSINFLEKVIVKVLKYKDSSYLKQLLNNFFKKQHIILNKNKPNLVNLSKFYIKKFIKKTFPKIIEIYLLKKVDKKKYFQINYFKKNVLS